MKKTLKEAFAVATGEEARREGPIGLKLEEIKRIIEANYPNGTKVAKIRKIMGSI